MGLINAFKGAIKGTLSDQWKDVIQPDSFDEHTILSPGVLVIKNLANVCQAVF